MMEDHQRVLERRDLAAFMKDQRDLQREARNMRTGTDFVNRQVVVVGAHVFKGRRGTVRGWAPAQKKKGLDGKSRAEEVVPLKMGFDPFYNKARFLIQFEGQTGEWSMVEAESLADRE